MLFTPEYIRHKYSSFFEKKDIDLTKTKLPELCELYFEKKKAMRSVFDMDSEGRLVLAEYEPDADSLYSMFENTFNLFANTLRRDLYPDLISQTAINSILSNTHPNGQKFSRFLTGLASDVNLTHIISRNLERAGDLCQELPRLPLRGRSDLGLIVQNFFSELAAARKDKFKLVLSANPIDMAMASSGKVRSCNSLGGGYEQAPWSAANSADMAILRMENNRGELVGRNWVVFSGDFKSFVFQRVYGILNHKYRADAAAIICAIVDKKFPSETKVTWRNRDYFDIPTKIGQAKGSQFYTDAGSQGFSRSDHSKLPLLTTGYAPCICCGRQSSSIICNTCRTNCQVCRKEILVGGSGLCSECGKTASACKICGRIAVKNGNDFCSRCNTDHTMCMVCGMSDSKPKQRMENGLLAHKDEDCLTPAKPTSKCSCGSGIGGCCSWCGNRDHCILCHHKRHTGMQLKDLSRSLGSYHKALNSGVVFMHSIPKQAVALAA